MVQETIWFVIYVLLILGLAFWRDHHDARSRKHRSVERGAGASPSTRRGRTMTVAPMTLKRHHRAS